MKRGSAAPNLEKPGWLPPDAEILIESQNDISMLGRARIRSRPAATLIWTRDGRLLSATPLDAKGKNHGLQIKRDDSGRLLWCAQWVHGKQHGLAMQFDRRGRPLFVSEFVRGCGNDMWMNCGELTEIRDLVDDNLHGWVRWGDPRRPREEEHFWHGKRHGVFRRWDDGQLRKGYPRFYVKDTRISRRAYEAAQARDASLPPYDKRDDVNRRTVPRVVRDAVARGKALRRELALLEEVRACGVVRRG